MNKVNILKDIPKLPKQDQYLLYLQNNAYSIQTILNYARDLSIFSVYLHFNSIKFEKLGKEDVTNYKGYLSSGNHLKDLDRVREECFRNVLPKRENDGEAPRGSGRHGKVLSGMNTPVDAVEIESNSLDTGTGVYEDDFLTKIYSKVYGSLGVLQRPLNSRARSQNGLDVRSINRMLSAVRSYLKFRIEMDFDVPIPPDGIKMVKAEKKVKGCFVRGSY